MRLVVSPDGRLLIVIDKDG
jgi:periodic tryptophan protein 2